MSDLDVNSLLDALENESNSSIMNLTSSKIKEHKNNVLQRLQLKRDTLKNFHRKLKAYRYCSGVNDLQFGHYIRWIPLKDPSNLRLTNGGVVCDMKIFDDHMQVVGKNNLNHFFQIKFDEVVIFQKLSSQERVILGVLDYLGK